MRRGVTGAVGRSEAVHDPWKRAMGWRAIHDAAWQCDWKLHRGSSTDKKRQSRGCQPNTATARLSATCHSPSIVPLVVWFPSKQRASEMICARHSHPDPSLVWAAPHNADEATEFLDDHDSTLAMYADFDAFLPRRGLLGRVARALKKEVVHPVAAANEARLSGVVFLQRTPSIRAPASQRQQQQQQKRRLPRARALMPVRREPEERRRWRHRPRALFERDHRDRRHTVREEVPPSPPPHLPRARRREPTKVAHKVPLRTPSRHVDVESAVVHIDSDDETSAAAAVAVASSPDQLALSNGSSIKSDTPASSQHTRRRHAWEASNMPAWVPVRDHSAHRGYDGPSRAERRSAPSPIDRPRREAPQLPAARYHSVATDRVVRTPVDVDNAFVSPSKRMLPRSGRHIGERHQRAQSDFTALAMRDDDFVDFQCRPRHRPRAIRILSNVSSAFVESDDEYEDLVDEYDQLDDDYSHAATVSAKVRAPVSSVLRRARMLNRF